MWAFSKAKKRKSPGGDGISVEMMEVEILRMCGCICLMLAGSLELSPPSEYVLSLCQSQRGG